MSRDTSVRTCVVCHTSFRGRADARCCSATCRQRKKRQTYVVTAEDRAAMERVAELVPVPLPVLSPEVVRAHVLATAWRE